MIAYTKSSLQPESLHDCIDGDSSCIGLRVSRLNSLTRVISNSPILHSYDLGFIGAVCGPIPTASNC